MEWMIEMKIQENKQGEISYLWPALKGTLGEMKTSFESYNIACSFNE